MIKIVITLPMAAIIMATSNGKGNDHDDGHKNGRINGTNRQLRSENIAFQDSLGKEQPLRRWCQ